MAPCCRLFSCACKSLRSWLSHAARCLLPKLSSIHSLIPPSFPPSHQAQAVSRVWNACTRSPMPLRLATLTESLYKPVSTRYNNPPFMTKNSLEIRLLCSRSYFHEHRAWHSGWCGVPTDTSRMNKGLRYGYQGEGNERMALRPFGGLRLT